MNEAALRVTLGGPTSPMPKDPEFLTMDGIRVETELVKDAATRCVKVQQSINVYRAQNPKHDTPTSLLLSEIESILAGNDA